MILKPIIRHAFEKLENHIDPARDVDQHGFTAKSGVITLVMTLLLFLYSNLQYALLLHLYDFSSAFNSLVFSLFHAKIEISRPYELILQAYFFNVTTIMRLSMFYVSVALLLKLLTTLHRISFVQDFLSF